MDAKPEVYHCPNMSDLRLEKIADCDKMRSLRKQGLKD